MSDSTVPNTFAAAVAVAAQFEDLKEDLRAQADAVLSGPHLASNLGYCARACEEVEEAIFNALNSLSSYLGNDEVETLLRGGGGWQAAKKAAQVAS